MNQAGPSHESFLLLTLEEISQLVAHSHDPRETLANIVRLIQGRCHSDVCSVYVLEPAGGELVLSATVGLKPESIGRVHMRLDEGLTGLVAERMEPVMVADAFKHPRFKFFPEAGEETYHSFLGVPLVESGSLQGVLVVQTGEPRTFSPSEVRMLVTVAAQLASLVSDAHLLELVSAVAHDTTARPDGGITSRSGTILTGTPLSTGQGVGQAYVIDDGEEWRRLVEMHSQDPAREKQRLTQAMEQARDDIARLSQHISELVGEEHGAILQAQLMILQDRTIEKDLNAALQKGASAEGALLSTLETYVAAFHKLSTPFFQERVYDIKDVFYRILWQMRPRGGSDPASERVVLVAREASVMSLFAVDLDRLAGVVVEHGGSQSHAAILARSLRIPMVGQVGEFAALLRPGRPLLVDGEAGVVVLDPEPALLKATLPAVVASPVAPAPSGPELRAGLPQVLVNVNLLYETTSAVEQGAIGVGLYRSEFLFLARRTLPTEDEQVRIYRKLIQRMGGRPVTIRTFDLRPDKLAAYSHLGAAARPYDWRLVLQSPPLQQLFQEQVRAILRAGVLGPVRIMIPLVMGNEVLDFVLETLAQARASLANDGLEFAPDVPLGVMIEVAAVVPLVRSWAERVSFFALGTNDLIASALGLDRDDTTSAGLADPLHPGLLRLIQEVVTGAHQAGRPVTVCGEMAADPLGCIALAVLQVDALSVPVNQLAATRAALAGLTPERLRELATQLLRQRTSKEVRTLIGKGRG